MAFEGLFIAIMKFDPVPLKDWRQSTEIAIKLKLNEGSIYEEVFWPRFSKYIDGKINVNIK
jgi:hypothetical protein